MNKVLYDIRAVELLTLVSDLVQQYKDAAGEGWIAIVTDSVLSAVFSDLESKNAELLLAYNRDRVYSKSASSDTERDRLLRSLKNLLTGYTLFPDEAKQEAAERLLKILKKYGSNLGAEDYATESAYIKSMLQDYADASLTPTYALLPDILTLLKALKTAQEQFMAKDISYIKEKASQGKTATDLKRPLVATLNEKLIPYLNAVQENDGYKAFASHVEAYVTKANTSISRRKKKSASKKAQDEASQA